MKVKLLCGFAVTLIASLASLWFMQSSDERHPLRVTNISNRVTLKEALKKAKALRKVILFWCPEFRKIEKKRMRTPPSRSRCGWCDVSTDKTLANHPDTGAIIFNNGCMKRNLTPSSSERRADQIYIWHNMESPASTRSWRPEKAIHLEEFEKSYFNTTMSFRRDSGFTVAYRGAVMMERVMRENQDILQTPKSMFGLWLVSNCARTDGARKRMLIYEELKKAGLPITALGRCFRKRVSLLRGTSDLQRFVSRYKFYFAFENSHHCRDYITEKFFEHGLGSGTVPVVWGSRREDYERIAPPHSFIHVEDFPTRQSLAAYLRYLDRNDSAYRAYFKWRDELKLTMASPGWSHKRFPTPWCSVCRSLHGIDVPRTNGWPYQPSADDPLVVARRTVKHRVVKSVYDWWYKTESAECIDYIESKQNT